MKTKSWITHLREQRALTQEKLARMIGVSTKTIWRIEKTETNPSSKYLPALARALGVTMDELLVGERMTNEGQSGKRVGEESGAGVHIPIEREVLRIPVLSLAAPACAGSGNGLDDMINEMGTAEVIHIKKNALSRYDEFRRPFAVYVEGDSMEEQRIPDGALVVVNPAEEWSNGDILLVAYKGRWSLKAVIVNSDRSITLKAGKPQYNAEIPAEIASEEHLFRIIGKVVEVNIQHKPLPII